MLAPTCVRVSSKTAWLRLDSRLYLVLAMVRYWVPDDMSSCTSCAVSTLCRESPSAEAMGSSCSRRSFSHLPKYRGPTVHA